MNENQQKLTELEKLKIKLEKAEELFKVKLHIPTQTELFEYLMIKRRIYFLESIKFLIDSAPETLDFQMRKDHLKVVLSYLKSFNYDKNEKLLNITQSLIDFISSSDVIPQYMDYEKNYPKDHVSSYKSFLSEKLLEYVKVWKEEHNIK